MERTIIMKPWMKHVLQKMKEKNKYQSNGRHRIEQWSKRLIKQKRMKCDEIVKLKQIGRFYKSNEYE